MIQRIYEVFESLFFPKLVLLTEARAIDFLREARETPFDWLEWVGILVALGFVAVLTRYNAGDFGVQGRVAVAAVNFLVAAVLLGVLVGPVLIRRTRRGLRSRLH